MEEMALKYVEFGALGVITLLLITKGLTTLNNLSDSYNLCAKYKISVDRKCILGHRDLMATICPGKNLYNQLDEIIAKANGYEAFADDIEKIAILARRYESNGDHACVSSGVGDLGGISYGVYQLASKVGSVDNFVKWLVKYPDEKLANYGRELAKCSVNSPIFISTWRNLGTTDPGNFGKLQDEFIKTQYYDVAVKKLAAENYHVGKHSDAVKAVIFSRAVQNGASGCVSLFNFAVKRLGYANLSYVDDEYFDRDMIAAIYDFLIAECDSAQKVGDIWRSANNFCRGSAAVIQGLRNRFVGEKYDALNLL